MKEYEWKVDVVIAIPDGTDADALHEAIWSAVVDVVEAAGGQMGGGDSFKEWSGDDGDEAD